MGCFCDCHFDQGVYNDPNAHSNHVVKISSLHPVFSTENGDPALIHYYDDNNNESSMLVSNLYHEEKVVPSEKCDSILAKLIYSQAQFKAAEDNASHG